MNTPSAYSPPTNRIQLWPHKPDLATAGKLILLCLRHQSPLSMPVLLRLTEGLAYEEDIRIAFWGLYQEKAIDLDQLYHAHLL